MRVLIVDDEALARTRLQHLLEDASLAPDALPSVQNLHCSQVADALQAMAILSKQAFDVIFLDIHMPGATGLQLAREIRALARAPLLVFVTAHAEHALQAFELDAIDYLSKPVTAARLAQTLQKIERSLQALGQQNAEPEQVLLIHERGRLLRLPLAQVLCIKAELKYLTVCTAQASHLLDGSLGDLEQRHGAAFVRIHRSILVNKQAMVALEKLAGGEDAWAVRLQGFNELLPISRRQLAAVRQVIQTA